jgi:hypothetical protein
VCHPPAGATAALDPLWTLWTLGTLKRRHEHQMRTVFLLWHSRPREGGIDEHDTDDKLIGVYSSAAEADAAKQRKLKFPGFRDYPDYFQVSKYEVDKDAWSEGFGR